MYLAFEQVLVVSTGDKAGDPIIVTDLQGAVLAEHLIDHFDVNSVMVRATKPEPPLPLPPAKVSNAGFETP